MEQVWKAGGRDVDWEREWGHGHYVEAVGARTANRSLKSQRADPSEF
jgi:hypothetical protein